MIAIKILGLAIKAFGSLVKRQDFYFLGHYLAGSGRQLNLKAKQWGYSRSLEGLYTRCGEDIRGLDLAPFAGFRVLGIVEPSPVRFYRAWGKALLLERGGRTYMGDRYEFYAWCGAMHHFGGCGCQQVCDNQSVGFNLGESAGRRPCINIRGRVGAFVLSLGARKVSASLEINDGVFEGLGAPFYTLMEL